MRSSVCPGSLDPITLGQPDTSKRASQLFDQVIVLVVVNPDKAPSFTPEERMEMIRLATADIGNITVDSYDGLLIDYVRRTGAAAIVKGLRAVSDFEYEFQMAMTNKKMYPYAETLFLTTSMYNMYLSSSLVKQIARFGGDISDFVPFPLHNFIYERLTQGRGSFNEY